MQDGLVVSAVFLLVLLLLARWRLTLTLDAVRNAFGLPIGLLGDAHEGLLHFIGAARQYWRQEFREYFGLPPLLGGLLIGAAAFVAVLADFRLLQWGLQVLLGTSAESEPIPFIGTWSGAALIALTGVSLALIFGHLFLDLSGLAQFFEWNISPRAKRLAATLCLLALLVVCALQGAIALVRAWEDRQAGHAEALEARLLLDSSSPSDQALPSVPPAPQSVFTRFWDGLPIWVQAALGFLVPLAAGIIGAFALHRVTIGVSGLAVAGVIGPIILLAAVVRLVLNFLARSAAFVESGLRLIGPADNAPAARGGEATEMPTTSSAHAEVSTTIPDRSAQLRTTGLPQHAPVQPAPDRYASSAPSSIPTEVPVGPTDKSDGEPGADLTALRAALEPNPLAVPADLLGDPGSADGTNPKTDKDGYAVGRESSA